MLKFELLENPVRRKIILEFLKRDLNALNYDTIKELVSNDTSRPDYHLNLLIEKQFLLRLKGRGNYKLNEKMIQRLRVFFNQKVPVCLIGGLGTELSLFIDILDALRRISIIPNKYIILTSPEIKKEFESLNLKTQVDLIVSLKTFDYQTVLRENYLEIYQNVEKYIKKALNSYEIICELTGSTKPVSLALIVLANEFGLKCIYYSGKKIIWI
ncbi:MAG: hypothetical protein ACTSR8_21630 [Promethearchaeota archaeon]